MRKWFLPAATLTLTFLLSACALFSNHDMAEKFTVHNVYGDHMVLQRDMPVRIGGTAAPGKSVKVTIGENSAYAEADENGRWMTDLPAMDAGGPYTVLVEGGPGSQPVRFDDVLIGEVWLCSGQSNMEMPVWSGRKFWNSLNGDREAARANNSKIHLFNTNQRRSVSPGVEQQEIAGPGWTIATPEAVKPFSALGYYFGRRLQQDLDVPVGLINSSWGGTPIESWISADGYRSAGRTRELEKIATAGMTKAEIEKKIQELWKKNTENFARWEKRFYEYGAKQTAEAALWKTPAFNDSDWTDCSIPAGFASDVDGVMWFRRTVDLPAAWAGKDLQLFLGAIDDCDETYFNGVKVGAIGTETPEYWAKERKYTIPGKLVRVGRNVIAVRVSDMFGDGGLLGPSDKVYLRLASTPEGRISLAKGWKSRMEFQVNLAKIGERPEPPSLTVGRNSHFPATLYNSMIAPWTIYPIRGVIWYQGESNSGRYKDYMILHPLLIKDWRTKWNNPEMPFLFVQLAAFERHSPSEPGPADFWVNRQPSDSNWPKLREVQTATLAVPNTGMAVAIDIGDPFDIHPADKQTLAYRLAREAERIAYGSRTISAGPLYKSMKIRDGKVYLSFDNVGSGLVANGGELASFAIAGKDGKFVWAKAKIDGDEVVVWSDAVKEPVAVRYAWAGYPGNANLYNKEGFPASPFRTDQPDYLLKK